MSLFSGLVSLLQPCSVSPSDHLVIAGDIDFMVKSTNEHHVYIYNMADWDGFQCYLGDVPWAPIFRCNVNKAAKEVSDWH